MSAYEKSVLAVARAGLEEEIFLNLNLFINCMSQDYAAYTRRAGYIKGLQYAIGKLDEAEKHLSHADDPHLPESEIRKSYES